MHTGPVEGEYKEGWKPTKATSPKFVCYACGSDDVWYREWESSCGGYEDEQYECRACKKTWWVDGADS